MTDHLPPSTSSPPSSSGELWTTEQEGFALVPQQGDARRMQVPTAHQPALFDVGKPDPAVLAQRRAEELAERRARQGPVDDAAPLLEAAANQSPPPASAEPQPASASEPPRASASEPPRASPAEATARFEYVDVATGEPTSPTEPGTRSTGRVVADIDGEAVTIDEEDLVGRGTDADPRKRRYRYDADSPADYPAQARARKAARVARSRPTKQRVRRKGLRKTFDSAAKAAKMFVDHNEDFFDHMRDPWDGLRDWMDGIEVKVGRGHRKLAQTTAGKRILTQKHAAAAIRTAVAYVLGQAKGRRWESVDWTQIDRLGEALRPYFEPPSLGAGQPGLYWRPFTGAVRAEDLDAMIPAQRESIRDQESSQEIGEQLDQLRPAYARAKACLPKDLRKVIERRIRQWSSWAKDPSKIPDYACEPDPRTAGYLCNYPAVAGELEQLRRSCNDAYDPNWAADDSKRGEPGFPDTSGGENETPIARKVSAKACCSSTPSTSVNTPARKTRAKKKPARPNRTANPASTAKPKPTAAERKKATVERRRQTEARRKHREAQRKADRLRCSAGVAKHQADTIHLAPYKDRVTAAFTEVGHAEALVRKRENEVARAQLAARAVVRKKDSTATDRQRARRSVHDARCALRTAKGAVRQRKRDLQRAETELGRTVVRINRRHDVFEKRQRAADRAATRARQLEPGTKARSKR